LQALELLAFQDLSCPQLAASMQIHQRTARRLLQRLEADGYVEQSYDNRRRYRATLRLAALGAQVTAHAQLPRLAAPYVAELHATTGATTHLVIPSYRDVTCVVHCDQQQDQTPPEPGLRERLPAHAAAGGKILLAYREHWRESVLTQPLARRTRYTITSATQLRAHLSQIRDQGYALDDREQEQHGRAIAAPILANDIAVASLVASVSAHPQPLPRLAFLIDAVTRTASSLTRMLDADRGEHVTNSRRPV
jgi:DNA-binding IclR family transcriptional regulator